MRSKDVVRWIAVLTTFLAHSDTFLFENGETECPAPSPCRCQYDEIYCEGHHMGSVPSFKQMDLPDDHFAVNLATNSLASIPANAFVNLRPSNMTKLDIALHDNRIVTIADGAFNGVSDNIFQLYLDDNELTSIPKACENLTNLEELSVENNPITSLSTSASVLANIGRNLKIFSITLNLFSTWPREFQYLEVLEEIFLTDIRLSGMESNAFDGMKDTLKILNIDITDLTSLPEAICNLPNLETLLFTNNGHLSGDLFRNCSRNMPSVTDLVLSSNHFTRMPNIFDMFPSLRQLDLSYNLISDIVDHQVHAYLPLNKLNLEYNLLTSIPTSLGKLTSLEMLKLSDNRIQSIGENDFSKLSHLKELYLDSNPISTIVNTAFRNNAELQALHLSGGTLRQLPTSLAGLSNLRSLYLQPTPIECSCSAMAPFKSWSGGTISIVGSCDSPLDNMSISGYVNADLSKCT